MVWGVLAGLGPGMMERRESDEKIASSKSKRTIAEAQEGREAKKFEWWQRQADIIGQRPMDMYQQGRNAVDNPELWAKWQNQQMTINNVLPAIGAITQMPYQMPANFGQPAGQGEAVQPDQTAAIPQYTGTAEEGGFQGTSASSKGYQRAPGAADGGPIQVPAQPPMQQALPMQQPPQQQPPQQQPQQKLPSRRERYNEWYGKMERMSFLNGGMEGLQQFRDMEDAASRRQALGYAQQSATAMNEGMVGEAMRLGNSALESLSFDSGMEFVAQDGKLHLKGRDGSLSTPLQTRDLMGFVDQYMKTPEQYLDWKKAEETQRSNMANELTNARNAAVGEREARVRERQITLDEELEPRKTAATEATALAALRNSDAALARAMDKAGEYGWDKDNTLRISTNVNDWVLNKFEGLSDEVDDYYNQNQQELNNLRSGVAQIILSNPWDEQTQSGYVDENLAATVYQLVTLPGGMDMGGQKIQVGTHSDVPGEVFADYNGKTIRLPPQLHDKARALNPEAFKQQRQGALPGANTQTNPSGGETQSSLKKFNPDQIHKMDAAQVIQSGETWAKNGYDVQDVVDKIMARGGTTPLERKQMQEMLDGLS